MRFEYFTKKQAEMFSFYRIPKLLFTDPTFKDISTEAKVVYGFMIDRMSLSIKNGWFDSDGHAYIFFGIDEIAQMLNCGKNKAVKCLKELDAEEGIGLIEKRRKGQGKSSLIYVKNFCVEDEENQNIENEDSENAESNNNICDTKSELLSIKNLEMYCKDEENVLETDSESHETDSEVYFINRKNLENEDSRIPDMEILEVYKKGSIYTNDNNNKINNNNHNQNESNHILSSENAINHKSVKDRIDEIGVTDIYADIVKENINYDALINNHKEDVELIDELYLLILEMVVSKENSFYIAGSNQPGSLVKKKFNMLRYEHIEYVIDCLKKNTTHVKNIKKYMLASLYNAPSTMESYYMTAVNHDMPQLVVNGW